MKFKNMPTLERLFTKKIEGFKTLDKKGEPKIYYYIDKEEILIPEVYVDTKEYLTYILEEDEISKKFNKLQEKGEEKLEEYKYIEGFNPHPWIVESALKYLEELDYRKQFTEYTYNFEHNLIQDVQFTIIEINGDYYILLQAHNGSDARAGFSDVRMFKLNGNEKYLLLPTIELDTNIGRVHIDFDGRWYYQDKINEHELDNKQLKKIKEIKDYWVHW